MCGHILNRTLTFSFLVYICLSNWHTAIVLCIGLPWIGLLAPRGDVGARHDGFPHELYPILLCAMAWVSAKDLPVGSIHDVVNPPLFLSAPFSACLQPFQPLYIPGNLPNGNVLEKCCFPQKFLHVLEYNFVWTLIAMPYVLCCSGPVPLLPKVSPMQAFALIPIQGAVLSPPPFILPSWSVASSNLASIPTAMPGKWLVCWTIVHLQNIWLSLRA